MFSPTLRHLLSTVLPSFPQHLIYPPSPWLFHLLNIIATGFTATDEVKVRDMNEVAETAKLLYIDIKELDCVDNHIDSLKEEVKSQANVFDTVDSLLEIVDNN